MTFFCSFAPILIILASRVSHTHDTPLQIIQHNKAIKKYNRKIVSPYILTDCQHSGHDCCCTVVSQFPLYWTVCLTVTSWQVARNEERVGICVSCGIIHCHPPYFPNIVTSAAKNII